MFNALTWTTTFLCLTGTVLNVKKKWMCFVFWIIGNVLWLGFDVCTGLYSRAMLDIVQLGFAIWGLVEWKEKKDNEV